jgi:hypothetical protein
MDLEKLSDKQLYELIRNSSISNDMKHLLDAEFLRRNFSIEYIDELSLVYEKANDTNPQTGLSLSEKLIIIIFPWIPPLQAIFANKHIATGNKKKWHQHWFYVAIGIGAWLVIVIILARFLLFKK